MHIGGRWGHKERGDSHRDIQVKIVKISLLENPSPKNPKKTFMQTTSDTVDTDRLKSRVGPHCGSIFTKESILIIDRS